MRALHLQLLCTALIPIIHLKFSLTPLSFQSKYMLYMSSFCPNHFRYSASVFVSRKSCTLMMLWGLGWKSLIVSAPR